MTEFKWLVIDNATKSPKIQWYYTKDEAYNRYMHLVNPSNKPKGFSLGSISIDSGKLRVILAAIEKEEEV
jgi:hypothetical protein